MPVQIQFRRGTASEWTTVNPVLAAGELGLETDTLKIKIGDGATAWNSLDYMTQGMAGADGEDGEEVSLQTTETHIQWRLGSGSWTNLIELEDLIGPAGSTGPTGPAGADGEDGEEVELENNGTYIRWRRGSGSWTNLVAVASLTGATGPTGAPGEDGEDGADGTEIELQVSGGYIQWRYVGGSWTNLVDLEDITGPTGATGPANSLSIGTVTGGGSASATITGTAPTQTLDLVLPKGDAGEDGREVELRIDSGYIQWRLDGGDWTNLVSLASITGPAGADGTDGEDGEDGLGVPVGGSTGQVLAKQSGADNDTEWIDPPEGGSSEAITPIQVSISTASATVAKVGTTTGGSHTPAAGDIFQLNMTNGNSANSPTLNIDGSGAKNIRIGDNNALGTIFTGTKVLVWFDGTYFQLFGSQRNADSDTTYSEISEANIENTSSSTAGLITGRRAEALMDNEASKARTLTNKRITSRVTTATSSATPSINSDATDVYGLTALAANITSVTITGTPTNGQQLKVYIVATSSDRTITWGSSFEDGAATLPDLASNGIRLDVLFVYNSATSKWRCMASNQPVNELSSIVSTMSLTPDVNVAKTHHITGLDESDFTLNLPSNLEDGKSMTIRIAVAANTTFINDSNYSFSPGNDAPTTLYAGWVYEFVISRMTLPGPVDIYLISWSHYY